MAVPEADDLKTLIYDFYPELRTMAAWLVHREGRHHTLSRTALVHEAFLRLVKNPAKLAVSRQDFLALAAHEMRLLLIDYARRHRAQRRGGEFVRVPLMDNVRLTEQDADELMAIDQALDRLSRIRPRAGSVVELKFFAGFNTEEIARILGVSDGTVESDWTYAKAWLLRELTKSPGGRRPVLA